MPDLTRLPRFLARLLSVVLPLSLGILFQASSAAEWANNRLLDWRMSVTHQPATGQVVFVGIDAAALREVGAWPWSRAVHAELLDRLMAAGAADVLFDIDFAFAGDPEGDRAFADALDRAGGAAFLAVFAQSGQVQRGGEIVFNLPHAPFLAASWPAVVNVASDPDGLIRHYYSGVHIDGELVPTAAFMLAGGAVRAGQSFRVNFAIDPATIPTVSAFDILSGAVDPGLFEGRSVIVGAAALELGDFHAVPVHQVIPGALIHAVATETLISGTAVRILSSALVVPPLFLALLWLSLWRSARPLRFVIAVGTLALLAEAAALLAFRWDTLGLPTAFVHPTLIVFALLQFSNRLTFNALLLLRKEVQVQNSEGLLTHVFAHSADGIVVVDETGTILMQSRSAETMFGCDGDGQVRVPTPMRISAQRAMAQPMTDSAQKVAPKLLELPASDGPRSIEYLAAPSMFHSLQDSGARTTRRIAAISARDVTELKQRDREIAYLSNFDERTGAMRRRPFVRFLGLRLQSKTDCGVAVLNLHRFKSINVTLGREIGDAVLAEVVKRLQALDRGLSEIARLDGDSFAFFTELPCDADRMIRIVEDAQARVSAPYMFDQANAQVGVRIGYAVISGAEEITSETALARAEEAVDLARGGGGNAIRCHDPHTSERRARTRAVERAMPGAVDRGELFMLYQPQHRLSDGALIGVESLVRWKNPALGQIFPDEFIPIAEASGFILELGRFVLKQSCRDAMQLPDQVKMAVNVSPLQIRDGDLLADVTAALKDTGLPPSRLCLELTESVFLAQNDATIETMRDITWSGVDWALDDFGTGYSSMAYLSRLPLSKIKLDRSFTMELGTDPAAMSILRAMTTLCAGLNMDLLCEGVETEEQLAILSQEGCAEGQGYFFGKPQPIEAILDSARPPALPARRNSPA